MSIETRFKSIKPIDDTPKYPPAPKRYLFPDERTVLSIYSNLSMEIKEKLSLPTELATKIIDPWVSEMYDYLYILPHPNSAGVVNIASYFSNRVRTALLIVAECKQTRIQAMAWAAETEQSLSPDGLVKGKTLGDLFLRYRGEISPTKKSYRSEYNRLNKLSRDPLAQMRAVDIRQHHFDSGASSGR